MSRIWTPSGITLGSKGCLQAFLRSNRTAGGGGGNGLLTNLVGAWELDEASGNALDSHGSNDLTDNATVGAGTGLVYGTARDFENLNQEYFSRADNADLSTGDIDFTLEAWVNFESLGAYMGIAGKRGSSQLEYQLFCENVFTGNRRITFSVSANGSAETTVQANNFGVPSTGVWYHVVAWHDAAGNQLGIAVNDGTPTTASYSSGGRDGSGGFYIGTLGDALADSNALFDGLIGPVRFWKNRVLDSTARTALYNAGAGLPYASFTA